MATRLLPRENLRNIAKGAGFLGSGGGGAYDTGRRLIASLHECCGVNIVAPRYCRGKSGVVVACVGSPEKFRAMSAKELTSLTVGAVRQMMEEKGGVDVIIPAEVGPLNSVIACLTAESMGKAVMNGDGAGRAVPTLQLLTYAANHISVSPSILTARDGNFISISISDPKADSGPSQIEALVRPTLALPQFDQTSGLAIWYFDDLSGFDQKCVPDTLSLCQELGEVISAMQKSDKPSSRPIVDFFAASRWERPLRPLGQGKLVEATTSTGGGFDHGTIRLKLTNGSDLVLLLQNESLIAWNSATTEPVAMAPDIISLLVYDKGKQLVFTNGDLMVDNALAPELCGMEAEAFVLAASPQLVESEARVARLWRDAASSVLPANYLNQLHGMGYFGALKLLRS